jgi:hypothetical protein
VVSYLGVGESFVLTFVIGEMNVPSPIVDDQDPLLKEKSNGRSSFQPNPFWGSEVSRWSEF